MKPAFLLLAITFLFACNISMNTVDGNGSIKKEQRNISGFTGLSVGGPFQITVQQGNTFTVLIEADENLLQYIDIKKNGNSLKIEERDGYNLRSKHGIKVTVQLPEVDDLSVAGSGTIQAVSPLKNTGTLECNIAGSGKIGASVDAPEIKVDITGSGTANLSGQTRKMKVTVTGSGECLSENLKSEDCSLEIAGSGTARVFASTNLDINVTGSGDVYYGGKPQNVHKSVTGSGEIKEL